MSLHHLIWWAIAIALVVVLALTGAQLARALRELRRLESRVDAYADLPVVKALERGERDVARIEAALAQIEPLIERAKHALEIIRRGPIPPEVIAGARRLWTEIAAFRATIGR